jgi:hypothetical protein
MILQNDLIGLFHPTNARPSSEATTSVTLTPLEIWIGAWLALTSGPASALIGPFPV